MLPAVRPDPPQALTAHLQEGRLHLAWAPPASWPLPKSYFALLYWLQYELPNGTKVTGQAVPAPPLPPTRTAVRSASLCPHDQNLPPPLPQRSSIVRSSAW